MSALFADVALGANRLSFSMPQKMETPMHRAVKTAVASLNTAKGQNRITWESAMSNGRVWFFFSVAPAVGNLWARLTQPSSHELLRAILRHIRHAIVL